MLFLLAAVFLLAQVGLSSIAQRKPVSMRSETNEVYEHEDASEVLRTQETLYLYQTSYYWNRHTTGCMMSRYIKPLGLAYVRSIEYWGIDTSSDEPKFGKFFMTLKLTMNKTAGHQPFLHAEKMEKSGTSSRGNLAPWKYVDTVMSSWDYPILFADSLCLLTGEYGYGGTGSRACTLWVKQSVLRIPPRHCSFLLLTMCSTYAYNAYNHEKPYCDIYGLRPAVKPR